MGVIIGGLKREHSQRGTLVNVLLVLVLVFGVLSVSAAAALFQLNLNHQDSAQSGARRMAEGVAQLMVAHLLNNPSHDGATLPSLQLSFLSYPGSEGLVALDPGQASSLGIPLSVNNLEGTGSLPGWGQTVVAPETASIVAVGRYRGRERRIEVVLHRPAFPYVVASSVPIRTNDGLHVFAVDDPALLATGLSSIPPTQRRPGHIVTNAPDQGSAALELLGSQTLIEGDAQSRGTVQVGGGAQVTGEQRPLADLAPMPNLSVTSLDTATKPGVNSLTTSSLGATTLSGFNRRSGGLSVSGGLTLDGGVLYVDGDVDIQGGLTGSGALIANGAVNIDGGGAISGATGTALVAKGNVSLNGTFTQKSEFNGLIYTEGSLQSRYTTIAGSVVVNNPDPTGQVTLEHVTLIESPSSASISIPVTTTLPGTPPGMAPFPGTLHANLVGSGDPYGFGVAPVQQTIAGTTQTGPCLFTCNMNGFPEDYSQPPPGFPVTHPPTPAEPWYEIGVPNPMPADPLTLGSLRINNPNPAGPADSLDPNGVAFQNAFVGDFTDRASARAALIQVAQDWGSPNAAAATDLFLDAAEQHTISEVPDWVSVFNQNSRLLGQSGGQVTPGGGGGSVSVLSYWELDLSKFFNTSDQIRILSWREI